MLMWTFNTALIYKLYLWIIVDWVGVQDDKYEELLYCFLVANNINCDTVSSANHIAPVSQYFID